MNEISRLTKVYAAYSRDSSVLCKFAETNDRNRPILDELRGAIGDALGPFQPLAVRRILEIGCGNASILKWLTPLGANPSNLYGIDLLPELISRARANIPEGHFVCGDASTLHWPDGHFDLVLLFTVLSSIFDKAMAHSIASEATRVCAGTGAILWFDLRYPNPFNRNVRRISRPEIKTLFSSLWCECHSITVVPPLARQLPELYRYFRRVPILRTHWFGVFTHPQKSEGATGGAQNTIKHTWLIGGYPH
jgi:SAM-dependent methyltransferase